MVKNSSHLLILMLYNKNNILDIKFMVHHYNIIDLSSWLLLIIMCYKVAITTTSVMVGLFVQ